MEKRYVNGHIERTNRDNTDEPLKSVIWILVAVTGYYFSIVAADCVVHYFLYSVAVCSKMSFTVSDTIRSLESKRTGISVGFCGGYIARLGIKTDRGKYPFG